MSRERCDIFLSGGGPAGLIAAAALAAPGRRILLADPGPPPADAAGPDASGQQTPARPADLRSTAFLQPARLLFERIGLWERLAPLATPLQGLRIVDLHRDPDADTPAIRTERHFTSDTGAALGWNFMNGALRLALLQHLQGCAGVELLWGRSFARLTNRSSAALLALDDGRQIQAGLAVAADGRDSPLREAAGIPAQTTRYGQKALAFAVSHDLPHADVSTELYLDGGPFTIVPLPDHRGSPASAVVWMNPGPEALRLAALEPEEFARAATRRSAGILGRMQLLTGRALFPVITRRAERMVAGRVALVAEAAHVLPPIGAQGLNTSVADIAELAASLRGATDPGDADRLAGFAARRQPDIARRGAAIDLFNRVTRSPDRVAQELRHLGLTLFHDLTPLRDGLIRAGMGPLPR